MTTISYVHLYHSSADSSDPAKKDEELVSEGWFCSSCSRPKPGVGAVDIQIYQKRPACSPLDYVAHTGVHIARYDFLSLLGEQNVARDLMLGAVYGPSGAPIDGWVTVRGRHRVIVRGMMKKGFEHYVGTRICEACRNLIYSAYPPNYLYPAPNPDAVILQSQLGGLVVRSELIAHLDLKRKKGFGIEKLKVLEKPKDGLGELTAT
jgi:hypothetical protein